MCFMIKNEKLLEKYNENSDEEDSNEGKFV